MASEPAAPAWSRRLNIISTRLSAPRPPPSTGPRFRRAAPPRVECLWRAAPAAVKRKRIDAYNIRGDRVVGDGWGGVEGETRDVYRDCGRGREKSDGGVVRFCEKYNFSARCRFRPNRGPNSRNADEMRGQTHSSWFIYLLCTCHE